MPGTGDPPLIHRAASTVATRSVGAADHLVGPHRHRQLEEAGNHRCTSKYGVIALWITATVKVSFGCCRPMFSLIMAS